MVKKIYISVSKWINEQRLHSSCRRPHLDHDGMGSKRLGQRNQEQGKLYALYHHLGAMGDLLERAQ